MSNTRGLTIQSLYPRSTWSKFLWRAPIVLWRLGLGPIAGRIFMIITTTGRKSGLPRSTMVEYHRLNGTKYAASGFGEVSYWYKNIQVDPRVTIQTNDGTESAKAVRITDDEELMDVVGVFRQADSAYFIDLFLRSFDVEPTREDILAKKDRLHFLRFDPTEEATPPGLEADLVWMWPVAFLVILLLWFRRK
jgi:deazaflavin-dependent oxidoreductase (nitroreductase family)